MKKGIQILAVVFLTASIAMGDLAGYWNFNEGSGLTAADSSGNSNTGSLFAGNSTNYPQWITGHNGSGYALCFNENTTSYNCVTVGLTSSNPLANLTPVFSFSMWVRRDIVNTSMYAYLAYTDVYDIELAKDPNGTSDWPPYDYMWSESNSDWQFKIGKEADAQKNWGSWYHLAITCDGSWVRKYINGVSVSTSPVMSTTFSDIAGTNLYLASYDDGSAYLVGALDDVAIWTGSYLPAAEVAKLANGTATPLTANDETSVPSLPVIENNVWTAGWAAIWNDRMSWDVSITDGQVTSWWSGVFSSPGEQKSIETLKWYVRDEDDYSTGAPSADVTKYGVEWVDSSWSDREPNKIVIASYITPGLIFGQESHGYELYMNSTVYFWQVPYFETNIRAAAVNAGDAKMVVKIYTYTSGGSPWSDKSILTYLDKAELMLDAGDYNWKEYSFILPKPLSTTDIPLWFEISIEGGNANTVLYIDEFQPDSSGAVTFKETDLNTDAFVDFEDIQILSDEWLEGVDGLNDSRTGGLLANGDFSADISLVGSEDDARVYMNPTGWTYTGTVANNYGIQRVSNRGEMNYSWLSTPTLPAVVTPLGGNVAAYLTDTTLDDPYGVLSQTTTTTAVSGQTYYAMGYVMTNTWWGWKDTATMDISIDGVSKASFSRILSRNKWRPVYGTYTVQATDAGKPIKISFSYSDSYDPCETSFGNMLVGYAYLGTTMPAEWPEARTNILVNGGFEDLSEVNEISTAIYHTLTTSDSYGGWFTETIHPNMPGWVYEVSSDFFYENAAGLKSTGYFGSPLPTPGMHDIALFVDNYLKAGQVVGPLTSGTTYYLDAACAVHVANYSTEAWPDPAPVLHAELWRIPADANTGVKIYDAIAAGTNCLKVAEAAVSATGNIFGPNGANATKWQIIGTSYTATSLDTNMYVRIYGSGGLSSIPEYAFSDVYLSTEKRQVPGGSATFELSAGLQYDVTGPYTCYHADVMELEVPETDLDGNCRVNLGDFAIIANDWLEVGFDE